MLRAGKTIILYIKVYYSFQLFPIASIILFRFKGYFSAEYLSTPKVLHFQSENIKKLWSEQGEDNKIYYLLLYLERLKIISIKQIQTM